MTLALALLVAGLLFAAAVLVALWATGPKPDPSDTLVEQYRRRESVERRIREAGK